MATITNMVTLQNNFEARMNEEILYLESNASNKLKEHELQSRLHELEYEFSLSRERHEKIFLSKPQDSSKKYLEENVFTNLRNKYFKVWGMISELIPKHSTSNDVFNSTCVASKSMSEVNLSKVDLPTFSGKYEEWMAFHNMFIATVHNNATMEPIVKLRHLKRALTGDAELIVRNLELNDTNYAVALKLLKNRYQHTRRLVNSYLKKLYDFHPIKTESSKSLKSMLNILNDCTSALQQLSLSIEDYQLVYHMCRKLPQSTLAAWEESQGASTDLPEFSKFVAFLETRFRTMEMIEPVEHSSKAFHINLNAESKSKPKHNKDKQDKPKQRPKHFKVTKCNVCKGNHYLWKCEQFCKMQQQSRFETVKNLGYCFNCLSSTHITNECQSKFSCKICQKRHHSLLHRYTVPQQETDNNIVAQSVPHTSTYHINTREQAETLLGTAQVKAVGPVGISAVVRALIDPCSEDNFIVASTVQMLHLKQHYSPTVIGVLGEDHASECSHRVELLIKSTDNRFSLKISAGVVTKITSSLPSVHLPREAFGFFTSLPLADASFNEPGGIQLLLGVNVHTRIILGEFKRLGTDLIAERSLLGYLIRGRASTQSERPARVMMTHSKTVELNSIIKKFWEIEEINVKPPLKPDDALCESIFKSSVHQNPNGYLVMDLPFKHNELPIIGPSRFMAVKRFLSLERKLQANANLKMEYHKTIRNYLDSNHLSKSLFESEHGYYLPHHAVVKESSTTTKVRVVFDASCRSLDGTSLNDHLLTGPKLQRDIRDILFNWRQYPFAITADIEKMYRMFFINEKHHEFQKIVWRFNEDEPIQDYVLRTATFGTSCAPFLAIRALQYIAELHAATNASASQAIKTEFYVDDFISGGFSIQDAFDKQTQVRAILEKYNLSLRKWSSNNKLTLSNVPTDLLEMSKDLTFDETEFRKTLGIYWSHHKDSFFFSITIPIATNGSLTKRQILSLIARLYDPLGWVAPCTMLAKQIMQKIWQLKSSWDEPVDQTISDQFNEFLTQLPDLKNFSIPRWTNIIDEKSTLTVLGFSDASDKGYSAVVYLVNPKPNPNTSALTLLTSKTKVADLKFQSIARLELNGALLLSELLKWTVNLYKPRQVQVHAFCDSKIVLAWLQAHPSRWQTYIANRTTQILEWMEPSQWNYVDTKINPADCASRGLLPRELLNHSLWINGPLLNELKFNQSCHLDNDQQKVVDETVKKNSRILHVKRSEPFLLLKAFSKHSKLLKRVTSISEFLKQILRKLILKSSTKAERYNTILVNLEDSENIVFRILQNHFFQEEIRNLRSKTNLKKESSIRSLSPFLDGNGILRVGGRLQNSEELTFDQRHPIILPAKHQVVTNLISEAHEKTLHGSELLTLAYLRNRFHIPRVSEKVRQFIHGCMPCFRYSKKQQEILMGSLPPVRVNFTQPFQHTGVDYAGPLTIKAYPGRCKKYLKSYIAVFVCLSTKAIHIELVSDLTSLAFIAAFKRFVGRRGRCHRLFSDNGKNFVGANKILQHDVKAAEQTWKTELENEFNELCTEWSFIPPASPHFGGIWEAGVKSIKTHLKKTVGTSLLTFEEMNTVLIQIEAVLNSRPLSPMSNNPNEFNYLTPGHFLVGRPLIAPPERCFETDNRGLHQRWSHVQTIYQRFVKLWKRDYLQNLKNRPKGLATTVHYQPGNLVLLAEDDSPPTLWPMVVIDEVHPGKDGIVRVATVRTPHGKLFKRPVVKLRFLPCNEPLEN